MKTVELYIEDKKVDIFGDEGFTLTFSIAEISEIGKKASSFSKEITLPANDNNNRIFTSLFDVTVEGGFNPISRKRAVLYVDSVPLMIGYFKLNSINIKDAEFVTYKGVLYEEQTNFINAIEGFNLDNLVIPVTGSTQVIEAPYNVIGNYAITGITAAFIAKTGSTNTYKGFQFGGLAWTGTTYGVTATKPRSTTLPSGVVWDPATVMTYKATQDQITQVEVDLLVRAPGTPRPPMRFKYAVIKSDFTTPIGGATFTDYTVMSGEVVIGRGTGTVKFTCRIPLFTNDEYRIEIYEDIGINFDYLSGTIKGKVLEGTIRTISGHTVSPTSIIDVTENVNSADDGLFVYPIIDYGERYRFFSINLGRFFSLQNTMFVNADVMRPWVYVKHVWDAIFKQAGFTYKSNFLNSPDFKKMIIGGGIEDDSISSLVYSSYVNGNRSSLIMQTSDTTDVQDLNSAGQVIEYFYNQRHMSDADPDIVSNNEKFFINDVLYDPYFTPAPSKFFVNARAHSVTFFSTGNLRNYYGYELPAVDNYGVFPTASQDGKYRVHAKLTFTSHPAFEAADPSIKYNYPTTHLIQIQKLRIGSFKYFPTSSTAPEFSKWEVIKERRLRRVANLADQEIVLELNEVINLNRGDMIRVIIIADANREGYPTNATFNKIVNTITLNPNQNETFLKFYRMGTLNGQTITNAATLLPRSFKQKDFILELAKMFNLYFEVDKENPKSLLIEPRDAYYAAGKVLNYERKIDYSKEFNLSILSHDYAKNQIFKYKDDDKDYLSTQYANNSANELIFGSYFFQTQNEYNFDEQKLELKFAPSYSQQISLPQLKITRIHDPKLYDAESQVTAKPIYKIDPRIMFYKKVDLTQFLGGFRIILTTIGTGNYTPIINGVSPTQSTANIMLNYGYAGHLNDPATPTFDLNWFTDFNYIPDTIPTNNNLFNIFYKNEMIELTDQSARKLECFVDLKPYDIVNLKFNDIYYFKKDYWRLIEISDYDTSSDITQTTKCTFIKVVRAQTNEIIDYQAFGYAGLSGGSAGGLTGTPLDQSQSVAIGGGTVIGDFSGWDTIERINEDRNKLNYDLTLSDTPIFMPLDEFITPLIDIHSQDIADAKDVTLLLQDNITQLGGGDVIILTDEEYPAGTTINLQPSTKRVLIENDFATFEGETVSEIILPALDPDTDNDIYDNYTLELTADIGKGAKFTVRYVDINGDNVVLYTPENPLIVESINEDAIQSIKFTYWQPTGKYIQTITRG